MLDPYADFERIVLPNGLTIFVSQVDREFEIFGFVVHAGSREDPIGKEGLAHFVEHCVSENVPNYPPEQIENYFEKQGGYINLGNTNYLRACYRCKFQANVKYLRHILGIVGTMLLDATLTEGIEKQRKIILQEYRDHFPYPFSTKINQLRISSIFHNHKLSKSMDSLGREEIIRKISAADLQAYHDQFYTPANISIVAIGKFSSAIVKKAIAESPFGQQKTGRRLPLALPQNPDYSQRTRFDVKISQLLKTDQQAAQGNYESYASLPGNMDKETVHFFAVLLGKLLSREIREKTGRAYDVTVDYVCFQDLYEFYIDFHIDPTGLLEIEELVDSCIKTVLHDKKRFQQEKENAINAPLLLDISCEKICKYSMNDIAIWNRIISNTEITEKRRRLTSASVAKILEYLEPEKRTTIISHP